MSVLLSTRRESGRLHSALRSVGLLLLVGAALFLGGRLLSVHDRFGEWALTPSATPPKVEFRGREYDRNLTARPTETLTPVGTVAGGTEAFVEPGTPPPALFLRSSSGLIGYGCACGGD